MYKKLLMLAFSLFTTQLFANEISCVDTTFKFTINDKVCIQVIKDKDLQGVSCYVSYAKTGGAASMVGMAEDPSRFSVSCAQNGPLIAKNLPKEAEVGKISQSAVFKKLRIRRIYDKENQAVIYLAYSDKLIDGSPQNSISLVPLRDWAGVPAKIE